MPLFAQPSIDAPKTVTLGSAAATLDITGISAQYRKLIVEILARSVAVATSDQLLLRLGTGSVDAGTNYYWQWLHGLGAVTTSTNGNNNYINAGYIPGASAPANVWGRHRIEIPFHNVSGIKRGLLITGVARIADAVDSTYTQRGTAEWTATTIIERIRAITVSGSNLAAGSRIDVYGVR